MSVFSLQSQVRGSCIFRQDNPAGSWPRFSLSDEHGQVRPDGVYKWELVFQAGCDTTIESGWAIARRRSERRHPAGPEEVDEVVPEVVAQENGKPRGVNYDNLVAVLVEAIKEQQRTIEKLERQQDELTGLKAEIDRLKLLLQDR